MYSRPVASILQEVQRLLDCGFREIVLTGIHLGHYGVDFNRRLPKDQWTRLSNLVECIAQLPGDFRVRLSSIEATEVTRELISVMAAYPDRICPHLHVSLQSGSDSVLRRMQRRWGARRFVDRCRLVQEHLDRPALTTDVMVGFPGETDADFEATCQVVREVGFSKIHVFPFSPRDGTPAAQMEAQITRRVKQQRSQQLATLEAELRDQFFRSLLGHPLRVLVEGPAKTGDGWLTGTSCRYAPVDSPDQHASIGSFADITPVDVTNGRIRGDIR
jgi:threonylcarbamoyladenosine tRNA methylthiotransferase MtaB